MGDDRHAAEGLTGIHNSLRSEGVPIAVVTSIRKRGIDTPVVGLTSGKLTVVRKREVEIGIDCWINAHPIAIEIGLTHLTVHNTARPLINTVREIVRKEPLTPREDTHVDFTDDFLNIEAPEI